MLCAGSLEMIVITKNSVYEFDFEGKRVRRVSGANPPTSMQASDGEWQDYAFVTGVAVGECANVWLGRHLWDGYRTSEIQKIHEEGIEP